MNIKQNLPSNSSINNSLQRNITKTQKQDYSHHLNTGIKWYL